MKHVPRVSIIIPTYQRARDLPDVLDNIFAQTYRDFEVIVVNDGSTDTTQAVLAPYADRMTLINQENKGRNPTRNRGARAARGSLLLFCDADVLLRRDCLAMMVRALDDHAEASYAYGSFLYGWKKFALGPFDAARLRTINYVHTTSLLRREHFPGFDEAMQRLQDWDLWLTMLAQGHTGVWVPAVLFRIRTHREGLSSWLPSIVYKIPWNRFGIRIPALERYRAAERRIRTKHHLPP